MRRQMDFKRVAVLRAKLGVFSEKSPATARLGDGEERDDDGGEGGGGGWVASS